ncbi:MAG: GNAT family N-acetyltransferase [Clostridiales bacterium]|nr:GNAT family N-acetyltransferase [Clostridiales bacterium]
MKILYETERLIIREWQTKDYKDLYEYASNPIVSKFLSFKPYTNIEEAKERIKKMRKNYSKNTYLRAYAISLKENGKVIGSIDIDDYLPKADGIIEIGYILNEKFQGKGYMTEALVNMFKYIKHNNIAKRIVCKHDTLNIKSGNVMKRAGMTFEGILRKAGKTNNTHARYDLALYSILYEEIE